MDAKINKSMTKAEVMRRLEGVPTYVLVAGQIISLMGALEGGWMDGRSFMGRDEIRQAVLHVVATHFQMDIST